MKNNPVILIADDHSVVRIGTLVMIRELAPAATIDESPTFDHAVERCKAVKYDLILLDIQMPGGGNVQMIDAIRLRQPEAMVVVFSTHEEELYALPYIYAGADGYIAKSGTPDEIKRALAAVLSGEKYLSPKVLGLLLEQKGRNKEKAKAGPRLSGRELEVMALLVKGASNSDIKDALNIHHSTVSTFKKSIFRKMNVSNVVELINKRKTDGDPPVAG